MKNIGLNVIRAAILATIVYFVQITPSGAQSYSANNHIQYKYLTDTTVDFDRLISQFKGKIIYVDVWATWCNPGRRELRINKAVHGFKRFADQNNIVLLYICFDKNGSSWKEFIAANKLSGYHLLVNSHIDKDFHTTFSSVQTRNGKLKRSFYIPRHIIVDTAGRVADSTAGSQGTASVYALLNSCWAAVQINQFKLIPAVDPSLVGIYNPLSE